VKVRELRELTDAELSHRLHEACDVLFGLRVQAVTGELDDNHSIRRARRDIARIKTLLHERDRAGQPAVTESE